MAWITTLFSGSVSWQHWLLVYLVVGALAMTILWTKRASRERTFANEVAVIIQRELDQKKSARQRFLEKQLMPASALLFAWLFWPFIVMGRIWVAWRR